MDTSLARSLQRLDDFAASASTRRLPAWGDRRSPMPTERLRFQFLQQVPLLERIDERVVWSLAYEGANETVAAKETIIEQGAHGRDMRFYLVRSGEVLVTTPDPLEGTWIDDDGLTRDADGGRVAIDPITGGRVLARLTEGDFFGESALLTSSVRAATVRAGVHGAELVSFDAQSFHTRIAEHVLVFQMVREEFSGSIPDVRRLGLFNDMSMRDLSAVLHGARQERFTPGMAIVNQGDEGDRFYIILDGAVLVERDGKPVARLGRGDHFGEVALLRGAPRNATVRATDVTQCWSITREAFELVIRCRLLDRPEPMAPRPSLDLGGVTGSSLAARLRRSGS